MIKSRSIPSLAVCFVLVFIMWMPGVALGGGFGSFGGVACGPYVGRGWGYGGVGYGGIGIGGLGGRPAYSGYYFRSWNGGISIPVVDYGPAYYAAPVVYTAPILYTTPASVHFSTLADHSGTMSRFHYGGAVRFGQ